MPGAAAVVPPVGPCTMRASGGGGISETKIVPSAATALYTPPALTGNANVLASKSARSREGVNRISIPKLAQAPRDWVEVPAYSRIGAVLRLPNCRGHALMPFGLPLVSVADPQRDRFFIPSANDL